MYCLNVKSREERVVYKRLNSTATLNQRTTMEAPRLTYVLHRIGCSQEDHQLLRKGCERSGPPGRNDRRHAQRTGLVGEDASAALDSGHGGDDVHGLDLRSPAAARGPGEGRAPGDVASDCTG